MLLKYFYDERLAQASYLIGCPAAGVALVIDPARDIRPYLEMAAREGLKITHVTETHIHADFVSGARELAAATGAELLLSAMGGTDWRYTFTHIPLHEGDSFQVGAVNVEVMHTPGHTPEHIVFAVTDTAAADRPMLICTGDFIFAGDVGRPDLLETAAGISGTKEVGAQQQFASIERFKAMPDYLQVLPGHGAGSACGKALGAVPSTTLGYEKLFNPAFQFSDAASFSAWLLEGQPEPPFYFARMKHVNKVGAEFLGQLRAPTVGDRAELDALVAAGALVVDFRPREVFAEAHVPGTINIPSTSNNFVTYVGWLVDYTRPLYGIVTDRGEIEPLLTALRSIGVDDVPMVFDQAVVDAGATESLPTIDAETLADHLSNPRYQVIDVRGQSEYDEVHIRGARHIPLGYVTRHLDELAQAGVIVVNCASGFRSQIVTSLLLARGIAHVLNLAEDKSVWSKVLPTEQG